MKIAFTGGGTGGHIFPIIAVARDILEIAPLGKIEFVYVGPKDDQSFRFLSLEGIKAKTILAGKLRRYISPEAVLLNIVDVFKMIIGFSQAFLYLFFSAPDMVFSKGGYGSFPVALASKMLGIPFFLHESDVAPGLVNKFSSKFALEIFTSFPKTEYFDPQKMILVGNPIREEMLTGSAERAKYQFKLTGEKPVILFLGGSQGARKINETITFILAEILKDFEILYQCGERNFEEMDREAKIMIPKGLERYHHLFSFFKEQELKDAYQAADVVISRAGAGTIFEIAALGKPSILIPLPESAQDHQVKNAYSYARTGAALIVEEANLTPHFLLERLKFLVSRPDELERMNLAAKDFARPRAAHIIANYLVEYLGL